MSELKASCRTAVLGEDDISHVANKWSRTSTLGVFEASPKGSPQKTATLREVAPKGSLCVLATLRVFHGVAGAWLRPVFMGSILGEQTRCTSRGEAG